METKKIKKSTWLFYRRRLRFRIFKRDHFTCQYCGRSVADGARLTIDHLVPISYGGDFIVENLVTSCEDCNVGKFDDVLSDWEISNLRREIANLEQRSIITL